MEKNSKFTVTSLGQGYVTLEQTVDPVQLMWRKNVSSTTLSRDEARELAKKLMEIVNAR